MYEWNLSFKSIKLGCVNLKVPQATKKRIVLSHPLVNVIFASNFMPKIFKVNATCNMTEKHKNNFMFLIFHF